MHQILTQIIEQLRNAWRFRWVALAVAWAAAIAGWLFVYSLPNQYEVEARVHIDTKSAIHPLLGNMAVTPNVDQQVDLLIQTILSRPNLKEIVRKTDLGLKTTTPEGEAALLEKLADRIHITNEGRSINLYRIAFTSSNADTARAVVQQVISIMTSMALGESRKDSAKARKFINDEVEDYRARLDAQERKLTQFRKDNAELLPGKEGYAAQLQALKTDRDDIQNELSAAQGRQKTLSQQVGSASSGGTRRVAPRQTQEVRAMDARIDKRQNKLERLRSRYTAQHPDIVSLKRQIANLKERRKEMVAKYRANPKRVSVSAGSGPGLAGQQLAQVNGEVSTLKARLKRKQDRIQKLKNNADAITDAQSRLSQLQRNYKVTKTQYDKLLTRLYSARLSSDVENTSRSLNFNIIDPPARPEKPTGPPRTLLMTLALAASLAAGGVFAFFLSQIRPVFLNRRELTDFTGLPVLGSVSMAWSMRQTVRRQTSMLLFLGGVLTLFIGYFGAVVFAPTAMDLLPGFVTNRWL